MMDMIEALKLIVARSPRASSNALRAILAVRNNSPVASVRYVQVLIEALADPEASFTPEERELIAKGIESPDKSGRGFLLRVRLTEQEQYQLTTAAEDAGMTISEYVRRKIFGTD
jgi:hypothetical protein